ncbi:RNA 2'-phosphotransferase [Geobacter pickeringii]|uniref:Probable RNA 2'-phosphotransferase n=2 Tax=Geobacter pickeringii TaxID=345632 RepID=A0A0B5BIB5_9BACT|nr:RNA 2'-phosphotransferase [Geobacter pickeringii]
MRLTKISKFLSLILRHRPEAIGLRLDQAGWVNISELIERAYQSGVRMTSEQLRQVVATSNKQRFSISADGTRIRANQGHSTPVNLGLQAMVPPEMLYHGTSIRSLKAIRNEGIRRGGRNHVHLSQDEAMARDVGRRHGPPVVLTIMAREMADAGFSFYRSVNGIWLTEWVPTIYISFPPERS